MRAIARAAVVADGRELESRSRSPPGGPTRPASTDRRCAAPRDLLGALQCGAVLARGPGDRAGRSVRAAPVPRPVGHRAIARARRGPGRLRARPQAAQLPCSRRAGAARRAGAQRRTGNARRLGRPPGPVRRRVAGRPPASRARARPARGHRLRRGRAGQRPRCRSPTSAPCGADLPRPSPTGSRSCPSS